MKALAELVQTFKQDGPSKLKITGACPTRMMRVCLYLNC